MLEEGRRSLARQRVDDCRIQAISNYDTKFYKETIEHFTSLIPKTIQEEVRELEEAEKNVVSGEELRSRMVAMFGRG